MIHDDIFENINSVIDYLNNQGWTLSKNYFGNAPYLVIDYGNNRLIYYPQPIETPLFRGQNKFYEPCKSSFYRFQPDKIEEFIQNLKIEEFRIVTSKHPVVKDEIENGLFFNYLALAQHYEFKTKMLDLTNSLPVAAFFAVTRKESNCYIPMEKSDEPGVLYFIKPYKNSTPFSEENEPEIYPVGWQIFKRPGEQRAFGVNLANNENLNSMTDVFAFKFWQDKKVSEQIYNMFHGGKDLFPKDIFAEKAALINESNIFSKAAFDIVHQSFNIDLSKDVILNELEKRKVKVKVVSNIKYSYEEIELIKKLYKSGKLTENLNASTRLSYIPDNNKK